MIGGSMMVAKPLIAMLDQTGRGHFAVGRQNQIVLL